MFNFGCLETGRSGGKMKIEKMEGAGREDRIDVVE